MFIQLLSHKQTIIRHINNTYDIRTQYFENGQLQQEEWFKNGKHDRPGGAPANIKYFKNGQIEEISWYVNGKLHRIAAPAVITYFKDGQIDTEEWYENGEKLIV